MDSDISNCGIYAIVNNLNSKIYIGLSRNIKRRISQHKSNSKNENFKSPVYQSIRKYGIENFTFKTIENCLVEELEDREIYWINHYMSSDREFGYNLEGGGRANVIVSEQTKTKLHLAQGTKIPIVKLNRLGEYIDRYDSINLCAKLNNMPDGREISKIIKENSKFSHIKGFIYVKEEDYISGNYTIPIDKIICKLSLTGQLLEIYETMSEAVRSNNANICGISKCCNLKHPDKKIAYGFIWRKYVDHISGSIKDLPTEDEIMLNSMKSKNYNLIITDAIDYKVIYVGSILESAKYFNVSKWNIRNCLYNNKLLLSKYKIEINTNER